jgi:hypothetical protein
MTNQEKRSLLLSMLLGDGCLHNTSNGTSGTITLHHGVAQSDYITWKAHILSNLTGRNVVIRNGNKGNSVQCSVTFKKFKAWRKFCYPNGKKSLNRILPFIRHPEFAVAVWLMDDGYVESSISRLADGSKKNYGARFRIFTMAEDIREHELFIKWFQDNLGVTPKIKLCYNKKRDKQFPFLKFTQTDSLKLWKIIREVVLGIKSMQYKFRYIEEVYQYKLSQRVPNES